MIGYTFYWLYGMDRGKRILWGPYNTEQEAQTAGVNRLGGSFEVIPLATRNETRASRMLRARLAESEGFGGMPRGFGHIGGKRIENS